jgi:hypothetical protein
VEEEKPCALMQISLQEENLLAWNLFWDKRNLGDGILDLYDLELDAEEAGNIRQKLRALHSITTEYESRKLKEAQKKQEQLAKRGTR